MSFTQPILMVVSGKKKTYFAKCSKTTNCTFFLIRWAQSAVPIVRNQKEMTSITVESPQSCTIYRCKRNGGMFFLKAGTQLFGENCSKNSKMEVFSWQPTMTETQRGRENVFRHDSGYDCKAHIHLFRALKEHPVTQGWRFNGKKQNNRGIMLFFLFFVHSFVEQKKVQLQFH